PLKSPALRGLDPGGHPPRSSTPATTWQAPPQGAGPLRVPPRVLAAVRVALAPAPSGHVCIRLYPGVEGQVFLSCRSLASPVGAAGPRGCGQGLAACRTVSRPAECPVTRDPQRGDTERNDVLLVRVVRPCIEVVQSQQLRCLVMVARGAGDAERPG